MIKRNDTNYLYLLIIEAIGITIGFVSLIIRIKLNIILIILTYIFSVIIPIILILIERKGITLTESIFLIISKFYIKQGDNEKAKDFLMKLIEKYPESYFAHKELAQIYEKNENLHLALEEYIKTTSIRPNDKLMNYKVADLHYKTGNLDESYTILKGLLKSNPEWKEVVFLAGNILYEQERFKEAVNLYLDSLKYHPDDYDIYYNLGMCYTRLNDFQSAKEYYEKAAQLNSLLYNAKYNLGQIALLYNELDEAEQYFIECLQDINLEEDAYYYLAYIAILRGDEQKAVDYLNTAVDENPEIYDAIRKELIFKVIFSKIKKPNPERKTKRKPAKIDKKDKETMDHLKNMYELVGNLNNNEIKAISKIISKRKENNKDELKERE